MCRLAILTAILLQTAGCGYSILMSRGNQDELPATRMQVLDERHKDLAQFIRTFNQGRAPGERLTLYPWRDGCFGETSKALQAEYDQVLSAAMADAGAREARLGEIAMRFRNNELAVIEAARRCLSERRLALGRDLEDRSAAVRKEAEDSHLALERLTAYFAVGESFMEEYPTDGSLTQLYLTVLRNRDGQVYGEYPPPNGPPRAKGSSRP